jgi:hypothetical protein
MCTGKVMLNNIFRVFQTRKVVLRDEKTKGDSRYLSAEIKDSGNLVFEGHDYGTGVENTFGCSEYEWFWTIKSEDIELLQKAIGGKSNILKSLQKNFSCDKAASLHEFMELNNIPFEKWNRVGD